MHGVGAQVDAHAERVFHQPEVFIAGPEQGLKIGRDLQGDLQRVLRPPGRVKVVRQRPRKAAAGEFVIKLSAMGTACARTGRFDGHPRLRAPRQGALRQTADFRGSLRTPGKPQLSVLSRFLAALGIRVLESRTKSGIARVAPDARRVNHRTITFDALVVLADTSEVTAAPSYTLLSISGRPEKSAPKKPP